MCERTCLYYTMVMVPPLLSRRYTFVDLNERKVLAQLGGGFFIGSGGCCCCSLD